jgi:hypothetical protein
MGLQLQSWCKAPPLTEDRLVYALNHKFPPIRSLANIVVDARNTKKIPEKKDMPSMQFMDDIQKQSENFKGNDKESAFHIIWYIKELLLGRHPEAS